MAKKVTLEDITGLTAQKYLANQYGIKTTPKDAIDKLNRLADAMYRNGCFNG